MVRTQFYAAALLHDIGKLLQRSGDFQVQPEFREHARYSHAAFSAQFVSNYQDTHPLCSKEVRDWVWLHHQPDTTNAPGLMLQLADWLSSGERRSLDDTATSSQFNRAPLESIFSQLFNQSRSGYHRLVLLDREPETLLPKTESPEVSPADYRRLQEHFLNEFPKIVNDEQLYALLEKTTWAVPSATPNPKTRARADISLFDHSRTTAAIALCLFDQYQDGFLTDEILRQTGELTRRKVPDFLLVGGDFSGVQNFIYGIGSKHAVKSLKGRSFYLDWLADVIIRFLLKQLDLKSANVLYNGGANFYLLIPHSRLETLQTAYRYISRLLFQAHAGKIYLALAAHLLSVTDFLTDGHSGFGTHWQAVAERTGRQKLQRYREFEYESVFEIIESGNLSECPVCHGDMHSNTEAAFCPMCQSFVELTNQLKKATSLKLTESSKPVSLENTQFQFEQGYSDVFQALGFRGSLISPSSLQAGSTLLNGTDFLPANGFRFGVLKTPTESFDKLIEKTQGAPKLALLKMDVDNLGNLFQKGLAPENNIISRIAAISRELHLFFEGFLGRLLEEHAFHEKIYPVYSGGDDAFLIGTWDGILNLAKMIRDRFGEFACQNDKVTLSAGVVLTGPKFPIIRGADLVEDALHRAKYWESSKDKICLFDFVFTWDEFEYILKIKNELVRLICEFHESRAVLNKVMKSTLGFEKLLDGAGTGKVNTEKVWRFAWFIGRSKRHSAKSREVDQRYDDLLKIYEEILLKRMFRQKEIKNIMILPVACRLAELETRKSEKIKEN